MNLRVLLFFVFSTTALVADDYYLTPKGAGGRTGSNWESAFDQSAIDRVINEILLPGDTLHLGGGVYRNLKMEVRRGGNEKQPIAIKGVDRGDGLPVIRGGWSEAAPSKGDTAIRISPGVSDVLFSDLRIERYQIGVYVPDKPKSQPCGRLAFKNVDMSLIRHGFYFSGCNNLRLEDCDLVKYTKHGFRFDKGCSRVRVLRCVADCSAGSEDWERLTELFPFGFFVNQSKELQSDFRFVDCVAMNNLMPLQDRKYKNGDGFVVEESAVRVSFVRCRAIRNQDGGFDLKTPGVSLEGCVAVENSRAFRIWHSGTLSNCFCGFGKVGLWSNGGRIDLSRSTFYRLSDAAILTDDSYKGPVKLAKCLMADCKASVRRTAKGIVELGDTVGTGADEGEPPVVFRNPKAGWRGDSNAMDSSSHPDRGYVFTPQ